MLSLIPFRDGHALNSRERMCELRPAKSEEVLEGVLVLIYRERFLSLSGRRVLSLNEFLNNSLFCSILKFFKFHRTVLPPLFGQDLTV